MCMVHWWNDSDRGKWSTRRRGRQCALYKVTLKGVRETIVAVEKRFYISSMQGGCTIHLLSVTCLAAPYFSTSPTWRELLNIKRVCWFSLQLSSETYLILRRIQWDIITNIGLHVQYPSFLSDFNETWIFSTDFRKILKYEMLRKSFQWEPSCSLRTNMTKLIVAFRHFANAPKNPVSLSLCPPQSRDRLGRGRTCVTSSCKYTKVWFLPHGRHAQARLQRRTS